MTFLRKFGQALLLISKIIFILLTLYYIINYNIYTITFNISPVLRAFSIINIPLKIFETLGMSFLIIPLTIVIIATIYSKITWLQILSAFFTISGNLFSVAHLYSKGLLEDFFRTRLFTIFNAPSLEAKQKLFSDFFNQKINSYILNIKDVLDFEHFTQTKVNDNWTEYTNSLKTISLNDVSIFASKCAENLYELYNQSKIVAVNVAVKQEATGSFSWKPIFIGVAVVAGTALSIYALYKVYQLSIIVMGIAKEFVQMGKTQVSEATQNMASDQLLQNTNENVENLSAVVTTLKEGLNIAVTNHDTLASTVSNNATQLIEGLNQLKGMFNAVKDLIPDAKGSIALAEKVIGAKKDITDLATLVHTSSGVQDFLLENLQTIINNLSVIKEEILSLQNVNKTVITPVLEAALQRRLDSALAKIKDFNPDNIIKDIKLQLSKQIESYTAKSEGLITDTLTEVHKALEKSKSTLSKVEQAQSAHAVKIKEVTQALTDRVETDTKTTEAIQSLDQARDKIWAAIKENKASITTLREDFNTFKDFVIDASKDYRTMFDELKMKMETLSSKTALPSAINTMRRINNDNRLISMGTPVFNPLRGLTGALFPSRRSNTNNDNH